MESQNNSQDNFNVPPDVLKAIIESQEEIRRQVHKRRFYQKLVLEMHSNGTVKTLRIEADPVICLTLGLGALVVGSIVVYIIGPAAVVTTLKTMLHAKGIVTHIIIIS